MKQHLRAAGVSWGSNYSSAICVISVKQMMVSADGTESRLKGDTEMNTFHYLNKGCSC